MPLSSVVKQMFAWSAWTTWQQWSAWRTRPGSAAWSALPAPLRERLWAVVLRQRRLALARATGETLVLVAVLLIAVMLVDAVLHPLPEARRTLWWAGAGLSAVWFGWRALRPLATRVAPATAAALIDRMDPTRDELIGAAVQFSCLPPTPGSSAWMVQRTVALASQRADGCHPRRVLSSLRARRALLLAAMLMIALAVLAAAPKARPWLVRALSPWSAVARPSAVRITVVPGDQVLAQGAALSIASDVGSLNPGTATLRVVWADGSRELLPMTHVELGRYRHQLAAVPLDCTYQVLSGDGESAQYCVRTIAHPQVRKLSLRILPPGYSGLPERVVDGGDAEVLSGSRVRLDGELAGEPVVAAALVATTSGPERALEPERQFALTLDDGRPQHFWLDLQPTASLAYGLRFTGTSGQVAEPPQRWQLSFVADRPPSIDATALGDVAGDSSNAANVAMPLLVDLHQRLVVRVQAADDVALREVALVINGTRGSLRTEGRVPVALPSSPTTAMDAQITLAIDDHAAVPGDELSVIAVAIDAGGQRSASPALRLAVADAAGGATAACSARLQLLQRRWTAVVVAWPSLARGWQDVARSLRPGDPTQADAARLLGARLIAWHSEVQTLAAAFASAGVEVASAASASDRSAWAAAMRSWATALSAWTKAVSAWDAARRDQDAVALLLAANPAATTPELTIVREIAAIAAASTSELAAWAAPVAPAVAWMQAQQLLARARALRLRLAQVTASARGGLAWAGDPAVGTDIDAAMLRLSDEGDAVARLAELAQHAAQLPSLATACARTLGIAAPAPNPEPAALIGPPTIALLDRWQVNAVAQCTAFTNALSKWPVPLSMAWSEDALEQVAPRLKALLSSIAVADDRAADGDRAAADDRAAKAARVAAITRGWAAWAQTHTSRSGAAALSSAAAPDASLAERAAWLTAARALLPQAGAPPRALTSLASTTLTDDAALHAAQTALSAVTAWASIAAQARTVALQTRAAAAAWVAQVHERAAAAALRAGRALEATRQSDLAAAAAARVGVPRAAWAGLITQAKATAPSTVVISALHRAIAADFTADSGVPILAQQAALVLTMAAETQGDAGRLALAAELRAAELRRSSMPRSVAGNAALAVRFAAFATNAPQPDTDERRRRLTAWRRLADGGREELARQLAAVAGVRVPAAERQQAAKRLTAALLALRQTAKPAENDDLAARLRALVSGDTAQRPSETAAPQLSETAAPLPAWLAPSLSALAERAAQDPNADVLSAWWALGRRLVVAELVPLRQRARRNDAQTSVARRDGLAVAQRRAQLLRALDDGARAMITSAQRALPAAAALATAAAATGDQTIDQVLAERLSTLAVAVPAACAAAAAAQAAQLDLRLAQAARRVMPALARAGAVVDLVTAEAAAPAAMQLETKRADVALATAQALLAEHPGPLAVARALPAALSLADATRAMISATDPAMPVLVERWTVAWSAGARALALLPAAGDEVLEDLRRLAAAEQASASALAGESEPASEWALAQAALALLADPSDPDAGSALIAMIDRAATLPVGTVLAPAPVMTSIAAATDADSDAGAAGAQASSVATQPLLPATVGDPAPRAELTAAPWLRADGSRPSVGTPHLEAFPPDSQAAIRAYRRRLGAER